MNTEKLKSNENTSYTNNTTGKSILLSPTPLILNYFVRSLYSHTNLIITPTRNVMLTVPKGAWATGGLYCTEITVLTLVSRYRNISPSSATKLKQT